MVVGCLLLFAELPPISDFRPMFSVRGHNLYQSLKASGRMILAFREADLNSLKVWISLRKGKKPNLIQNSPKHFQQKQEQNF